MSIKQPNIGSSLNAGGGMGLSSGEGYGRRPWLMPQDLYRIQPGFGYIWATGLGGAIPAYYPSYRDVLTLNARARRNPYYKS